MKTDIRPQWDTLGDALTRSIDTLGASGYEPGYISSRLSGLQGARNLHRALEENGYVEAGDALREFTDLICDRIADVDFDASNARNQDVRLYAEGYREGLQMAQDLIGGTR